MSLQGFLTKLQTSAHAQKKTLHYLLDLDGIDSETEGDTAQVDGPSLVTVAFIPQHLRIVFFVTNDLPKICSLLQFANLPI